jgi:hypothetical protein
MTTTVLPSGIDTGELADRIMRCHYVPVRRRTLDARYGRSGNLPSRILAGG